MCVYEIYVCMKVFYTTMNVYKRKKSLRLKCTDFVIALDTIYYYAKQSTLFSQTFNSVK